MRWTHAIGAALLVAAPAVAQEAADESLAAWKALHDEYQAAVSEFFRPWQEARQKGEAYALDYSKHPDREFAAKVEAFANQHAKKEGAARALVLLLQIADEKAAAADTLLADHLASPSLREAAGYLRWVRPEALPTIAEKSPHADVRGYALLNLGQAKKADAPQEARRMFELVREQYADHPWWGTTTLGRKAEAELFELDHLVIGKEAPDIEGEDLEGKPLKLSDYRGKVVVLDFWGDW